MPPQVTFHVTRGHLPVKTFVFGERTTCLIGRDPDCMIRIPEQRRYQAISRLHCMLDVNPPDVRVRDLGSLFGTYLRDAKIGQRTEEDQRGKALFPEHDLRDGDEVRLGDPARGATVAFRVEVYVPPACAECGADMPDASAAAEQLQCEACRDRARAAPSPRAGATPGRACVRCGRDVSGEVGKDHPGEYVCTTCQAEPYRAVERLLQLARNGRQDSVAVQGYRVRRELGQGGMGAVYLAEHEQTGEEVALKVLLPRVAMTSRARANFLREAENTRALRHPNVVRVRDVGCSQGTFFFTMDYCEGGSVADLLKRQGQALRVQEAAPLILQALSGLEYTHQAEVPSVRLADGSVRPGRGLVHRDLKPHNLFLSGLGRSPTVRIGDYGLAKAFDLAGLSGQTCTGAMAGTPWFMPRQLVVNYKYSEPDVDVWAAAASLYFLLTGAAPRDFPKGEDPWQRVLSTPPVPIRQREQKVPWRLAEVIDQALIDQPRIAFRSATELRQALEQAL